ncbi:hypothetical protein M422DRAFT_63181 [Sphaerobolus stellatus SS14]|nr:hypothetical protein M422DRAFT_63181 [Sphaerobolus stellatus SS14]
MRRGIVALSRWFLNLISKGKASCTHIFHLFKLLKSLLKSPMPPNADPPTNFPSRDPFTTPSNEHVQFAASAVPTSSLSHALYSNPGKPGQNYNGPQALGVQGGNGYPVPPMHWVKGPAFLQAFSAPPTSDPDAFLHKGSVVLYPMSSNDIDSRKYPLSDESYTAEFCQNIPGNYIPATKISNGVMPKLTTVYNNPRKSGNDPKWLSLSKDWKEFIDPHGRVYYWNESTRTITDIDLYHPELLRKITHVIKLIYYGVYQSNQNSDFYIPSDLQLAITMYKDVGGNVVFGYYFATMEGRCLFWLGKHEPLKRIDSNNKKSDSVSHIRYFMEAEYWFHYKTFPDVQDLPTELISELKGLVLYAAIDKMANVLTTIDLSKEEIQIFTQYLDALQVGPIKGNTNPGLSHMIWSVGVIMNAFALHKFENFYGQKNVRWKRDQRLFEDEVPRHSFLLSFVSPFLLYTPQRYTHSLESILTGRQVFSEAWRDFVKELHEEWQALTIIATVILTTNVAFLAIQTVDNTQAQRSPAQILSYLSTVLSAGSILQSQLIAKYHRIKGWEFLDERIKTNFNFLPMIGSELLSIIYSFPYVFLTYSVLCFLAAFLFLCFDKSDRSTRISVGIIGTSITVPGKRRVYDEEAEVHEEIVSPDTVMEGLGYQYVYNLYELYV